MLVKSHYSKELLIVPKMPTKASRIKDFNVNVMLPLVNKDTTVTRYQIGESLRRNIGVINNHFTCLGPFSTAVRVGKNPPAKLIGQEDGQIGLCVNVGVSIIPPILKIFH